MYQSISHVDDCTRCRSAAPNKSPHNKDISVLNQMASIHTFLTLPPARKNCLLAKSCLSVRSSVRPSVDMRQDGSRWTDFHDIGDFYENLARKSEFDYNQTPCIFVHPTGSRSDFTTTTNKQN